MWGYSVSVFLHIVFAMFWVGGMLFLPLVMVPSIKDNLHRRTILIKSGLRFRYYGWMSLVGLIITGIVNMHYKGMDWSWRFFIENGLGRMLLLKWILFLIMVVMLFIHDIYIGGKYLKIEDERVYMSRWARYSARVSLLLSLLIVYLGVMISRGMVMG